METAGSSLPRSCMEASERTKSNIVSGLAPQSRQKGGIVICPGGEWLREEQDCGEASEQDTTKYVDVHKVGECVVVL